MTRDQLNAEFDKFLAENVNKPVLVLPSSIKAGVGQCFDVAVKWTDRLGVPHYTTNPSPFPYVNAKQIYSDFGSVQAMSFDRIENSPTAVPQKGDIVVWNGSYNGILGTGDGHVGVATGKGDTSIFECFEANDPLGSVAHVRIYNYKNVSGWLRPKVTSSPPQTPMNTDRRPYWFDRINSVTFKKPKEQIVDTDVEKFVTDYPGQLHRSGVLDGVMRSVGYTGDTNSLTVDDALLIIRNKYDTAGAIERTKRAIASFVQNYQG